MRYLHTAASLLLVLFVLLACKKREKASTATVDTATATAVATDTASAAPTDTASATTSTTAAGTVAATATATANAAPTHAATVAHAASAKASASAASSVAGTAAAAFKNGDKVDVQWQGDWWKASVIGVNAGPTYKVHYEGWGNEWDESVPPARIRARTSASRSK
jgi:hypothetical protein